jgi:CheY-like chemotaxis protein
MIKILLVEDNETNRDMLRRRLERKGYDVIVAIEGAEGVARTQADRPDIVLMDLNLPVLDGWEATRQIKANPQTQMIPVIALTANALTGDREKALAAGCDEYDTKPVDFNRLLGKIDALVKPAAAPPPAPLPQVPEQPGQAIAWHRLRHDLEQPIETIVGYSDMLLDVLAEQLDSALTSDLQKIHLSGLQLLKLIQAILNPVLLEVQQQDWTSDILAPALRRELLTPLSTIMGYCELLLEETHSDFLPDLEQIHTSAQDLLSLVNSLDSLMARYLESDQTSDRTAQLIPRRPYSAIDPSIQNNRILVIDRQNSPVARQLERQGYTVKTTLTANQSLANSFDLIVLDVSHLKVLEQLKSNEAQQDIPVLLIASAAEIAGMTQGIALGATDSLTKPFPIALLRTKVAACLEQFRLRQQIVHYESMVEEFKAQQQLEADLSQQLEALKIELEQIRRSHQAAEVVHTDYFQQIQPDAETNPASNAPLKVLLVEDNELNSDMLCRRLQRQGYEVVIATDGAEGVSKALSEQPQVILMDISLPVMDGWEATQHLKANPQTRHIPIIALTAHAMTGDREKALASGCDDYDTKPIELTRLLNKIEGCLKSPSK